MVLEIITDSASDITQKEANDLGIQVIPILTSFGDEVYLDGINLSNEEFFKKLEASKELPKTSQITPKTYREIYEKVKERGDQAIIITLSSKLSGSYNNAVNALDGYEDIVSVVDSENVCIGEQILVKLALELKNKDLSKDEIVEILNTKKKDIRLMALLDTLEYLKKGGRISSSVAFLGKVLTIKPVIEVKDGEVELVGKARGSKNGRNLLRNLISESGGVDSKFPFMLAYSGLSDELLKEYIKNSRDLYTLKEEELPICLIGSTIGTHAGPGAIAIAFFQK